MEEQIKSDLKTAMLARDEVTVGVLRMLMSELIYARDRKAKELSDKGTDSSHDQDSSIPKIDIVLTDQDITSVVQKEMKKRKEGAAGFRSGDREDMALKEESEAKVLEKYLPTQISDEELTKVVQEAINSLGASTMQDMGKVIGAVMAKVGQSSDGGRISAIVKEKLS